MGKFFDIYIQEIPNMSDDKVTIYTSPKNKKQLTCMIMHLQNQLGQIESEDEEK